MKSYIKRATDTLDYAIDYAGPTPGPWLGAGETITGSTWDVPAGITTAGQDHTDTEAKIRLSGGTVGTAYKLVNSVTTSTGEVKVYPITVVITA